MYARRGGGHYLDEEEMVCSCEEVVRDGRYLATEGGTGQLYPPLS